MATRQAKNSKPMTASSKGVICLVLLLALTVFVSCLSLTGMKLDAEGINILLPWVPVSTGNWPESLPLSRALGGGTYVEYTYTLPEDAADSVLQDATNTIRNRLQQLGEADAQVTVKDGAVRVELRKMDSSRLYSVRAMSTYAGKYEFADSEGNVVLTEKDIAHADVNLSYNNARTAYTVYLDFTVNQEGAKKLAESGASYLTITCDGDTVASSGTVSGNKISGYVGYNNTTAYNNAANFAFLINYGSVDVTLSQRDDGEVKGSMGTVLSAVLIVFAVLLVCALVYLVAAGKLTGLAAFLSVWCAVVMGLFFVATVVIPSSLMLNVGCLVAILLGVVLALYTAVTRTDAISKQITEGNTPKQASKLGFKMAAKNVWVAHGAVLALSLIMMIFDFSRSTGYCLASGVFASAVATLVMRLFQMCFIAISNKPSLFGKVK